MVDVFSKAHPSEENSNSERKMIQSLAKRKDQLDLPADKGKAAVIMDTEKYMDTIRVMLSDESIYKKLKKDPTHRYKEKLVALLTGMKDQNKIS